MKGTIRRTHSVSFRMVLYLFLAACGVFILFVGSLFFLRFLRLTGLTPALVYNLVAKKQISLKEKSGVVNILLLGIGGGDHEGADLTDLMMIVSLNTKKQTLSLTSIPRDIWSDTLKDKVNTAYHYGEEKKKSGGLVLAKVIAEDISGLQIQYAVRIDFSGFVRLIDAIGGVDLAIQNSFIDTYYPVAGKEHDSCPSDPENSCVYETIKFTEGVEHMDGQRALIYVRSRHAEGPEGGDFSRIKRQQDMLFSIKQKIIHPTEWISVGRIKELKKILIETVETDMNTAEILSAGVAMRSISAPEIKKISIDQLFLSPSESEFGGRFVLIPLESWENVHEYINKSVQ